MFSSTTLTVFGLAALGSSHMIMNSPKPFGKSSLNNSPLDGSGSDFPCKQRPGVYDAEGASNTWPLGSTQSLSFTGSAVHGGGSCQVSISYDKNPTASSTWKVIHSIEGGCPIKGVAGNNGDNANLVNPDSYPFTVPENLPTGTAVMAWTWFNKVGNREMYMNCAPITLTSGSSKRSDDIDFETRNITQPMVRGTAFDTLPDMFVANIPSTKCLSVDSADLAFPNPGDSLVRLGLSTGTPKPPTGPSCGDAGSSPKPPTATSAPDSSPIPTQQPTPSPPSIPGGVFATVPKPAPIQATPVPASPADPVVSPAPVASAEPVASAPVPPSAPSPAPIDSPASPAPGTGPSNGTTGSGAAYIAGSPCTIEGMWNCIGGSSFQRCGSGTWSMAQNLAAGTSCSAGEGPEINITATGSKVKRAIRFSSAHVHRHTHKF